MDTPLISIVIPTVGRPKYLHRAILSSLDDLGDEVEVVVVPNGPDQSWKEALAPFASDHRVRVENCAKAHANAARNVGLMAARGKYVRFLDDDDFLYPGASRHQCELLNKFQADICTGSVTTVTEQGIVFGRRVPPNTDDYVESVITPWHVSLPTGNVYRRTAISDIRWDESVPLGQDKHWVYSLCKLRDWKWVRTDFVVGSWQKHSSTRISGQTPLATQSKAWARHLVDVVQSLKEQDRLTAARSAAASLAFWRLVCGHFFMDVSFWSGILRQTVKLFPGTYPNVFIYKTKMGRMISPKVLLIATLPIQFLRFRATVLLSKLHVRTYPDPR